MSTIGKKKRSTKTKPPLRGILVALLVLALAAISFVGLLLIRGEGGALFSFEGAVSSPSHDTELDGAGGQVEPGADDVLVNEDIEANSKAEALELPIDKQFVGLYPNEARLASFLNNKGLDDLHIAAVIGVFKRETGNGDTDINPAAIEDTLIGHGIAQWSYERWAGSHYGRPEQGLKYYANDLERDWEELGLQLDYLWGEMTGEGPAADYVYVEYNHGDYLATATLEEAVDFFLAEYMNAPGAQYEERLAFAYDALERIA